MTSAPKAMGAGYSELSAPERDRAAWEAIRAWPAHGGVKVVHEGLDFSELSRWFLWDKVGRAVRREVGSDDAAFKGAATDGDASSAPSQARAPAGGLQRLEKKCVQLASDLKDFGALKMTSLGRRAPLVFVPHPLWHLERAAAALIASKTVAVVANSALSGYAGSHALPTPLRIKSADEAYGKALHKGIMRGLAGEGIAILQRDAEVLGRQIAQLMIDLRVAEAELRTLRPDAILVPGDNHPPFQVYVLLGRREGIPTIMLQHGLDCERFYLDEAYASAIAVWGRARLERYARDSRRQPRHLEMTGNPAHDEVRLPERMNTQGDYWLWVTRPHNPEKCYAPSRSPAEGPAILEALVAFLEKAPSQRLMIKPHPAEGLDVYRARLVDSEIADRVAVSGRRVDRLLKRAKLVITEDSTAGMDAMFQGKVVVFAHFAGSEPVTPFVEYGAALPAYGREMLHKALRKASQMNRGALERMCGGQRAFIEDHAGPRDGRAGERFVAFVSRVLKDR